MIELHSIRTYFITSLSTSRSNKREYYKIVLQVIDSFNLEQRYNPKICDLKLKGRKFTNGFFFL